MKGHAPYRVAVAIAIAATAAAAYSCATLAGEPAAIVEEIRADGTGLEVMDYVEEGRVIELGATGSVILGYLRSCWRERITGGNVRVGREQSGVVGGEIKRSRVDCDGGALEPATAAGGDAVIVFRLPPPPTGQESLPAPERVLFGTHPLITLPAPGGDVSIVRLDSAEPRLDFTVSGRYLDLAETKMKLAAGGLYRIEAGHRMIVFGIDPYARAGQGPVLGRLLRM